MQKLKYMGHVIKEGGMYDTDFRRLIAIAKDALRKIIVRNIDDYTELIRNISPHICQ